MNAIILAGKDAPSKEEIKKQKKILEVSYPGEHYFISEEDYKPLFRINGQPIVQHVINACGNSRNIDRVFVVGIKSRLEKALSGCSILECCGSLIKNAQRGYSESNSEGNAIFLSCDIPLIKSEHIDEFISDCSKHDNGLFVSVTEQRYLNGYEMQNRRYFTLKEGNYRWGNIFLGNPAKLNLNKLNRIGDILYKNRKLSSPSVRRNLIRNLGKEMPLMEVFSKLIRYFVISHLLKSKKLSIGELEKMAADYLNIDLKIVETKHHEPSLDIDSQEDLDYIKRLMLGCETPRPGFEPGFQP